MSWNHYLKEFKHYLQFERSLSVHTINAYSNDVILLAEFCQNNLNIQSPLHCKEDSVKLFISSIFKNKMAKSQGRIITGIKAFYNYLIYNNQIEINPVALIESPKLPFRLPNVLSYNEIKSIFRAIDYDDPFAYRDMAIIEVLYSCGLRVSECAELVSSRIYQDRDVIQVIGKGDKERFIPIALSAVRNIYLHLDKRKEFSIDKKFAHYVFLNKNGSKMSSSAIYNIVMKYALKAGITKKISPHTFRHSFASHLIQNGAPLLHVSKMLGHESILSTEIYIHLDDKFLRETIEKYHPRNQ